MLSQFCNEFATSQTAVATGDWLRRFFLSFFFLFFLFLFFFLPRFVRIVRRSTAAPFSAHPLPPPFCFCRFLSRIQAQFVPIVTGAFRLPFSSFSLLSFLSFFFFFFFFRLSSLTLLKHRSGVWLVGSGFLVPRLNLPWQRWNAELLHRDWSFLSRFLGEVHWRTFSAKRFVKPSGNWRRWFPWKLRVPVYRSVFL